MSYVTASRLTRRYDLSDPWFIRMIAGRKANVLTAVNQVSFSIEKGTTYALVGESGSGKSTIAKMLAGVLTPSQGFVQIDGHDFNNPGLDNANKKMLRQRVQMVFQSPYASLNPRWKIGDILLEPINAFNLIEDKASRHKRVIELLEQVGMSAHDQTKYPHEFSGGQRQRISIARALACHPELIICDEPTSALDVSVQAQVLNLLKDLQNENTLTYLFISHDLAVISNMADKIGVLKDGELVEEGETSDLLANPQHAYTKMLLAAAPDIGTYISQ
ncbi:MAG: ABC transporter ATP-binding protein [Candidatus Puniceispirillaceae bacterium]